MNDRTILDIYRHDLENRRDGHYVHWFPGGARRFSTDQFLHRTVALADGLAGLGIGRRDRVMILVENRPEWHMIDLALLDIGAVTVPIYNTLTPEQIAYQAADSGAVAAVVEGPEQAERFRAASGRCPDLVHLLQIDGTTADGVRSLDEILPPDDGAGEQRFWGRADALHDDDLVTIVYTSGTTGEPKGVMLNHRNLVTNVREALDRSDVNSGDHGLEFLPLCHMIERIVGYCYMAIGATRSYCSVHHVGELIATIRPTVFAAVPRVLEKVHEGIQRKAAAASPLRRALFNAAVEVGKEVALRRITGAHIGPILALRHRLADRLVLAKIRAALGGRLQGAYSGGAALPVFVNEFFHALGLRIQEAYGLSETSPVISLNGYRTGDLRIGSVGRALPSYELKLAADGELLAKGPSVFLGYWNKPEQTAEAFDDDGFFHTGDIAKIDDDGFIYITDRKKDLIVTSGGKNVAPQPIENLLKRSPWIDNAVLVGDARPYIVALLSPSPEALQRWAAENGLSAASIAELIEQDALQQHFAEAVTEVNGGLARFEQIKSFAVLPMSLSVDSGHLTPTMKVKRRVVARDFAAEIEALYETRRDS